MNKQIIEQIEKIKGVKTVELHEDSNKVVVTFHNVGVAVKCTNQEQFTFTRNQKGHFGHVSFRINCEYVSLNLMDSYSNTEIYQQKGYNIIDFAQYLTDYNLTDEWEKYLIGEAKNRGFVVGVKIKDMVANDERVIDDYDIKNPEYGIDHPKGFNLGCCTVYLDGKWAEIIPNEIDLVDGEIYFDKDKIMLNRNIFRYKCKGEVHSVLFTADNDFDSQTTMKLSNNIKPATTKQKKKLIKAEVKNGYFHELNK